MAQRGADVLILVNVGTILTPVWEAAAGQRGATVGKSADVIDASSKDSTWRMVLPGRKSGTISLDGLYLASETSYQALDTAMDNDEFILVRVQEEGIDTVEAQAMISALDKDFPDNDVSTISISFEINGAWTPIGT